MFSNQQHGIIKTYDDNGSKNRTENFVTSEVQTCLLGCTAV
jgi:antitoxin component YwqK of YwqJK toxin-antitoxin module